MRDRRVKALFRTCTAAQALQAWLGVFLNGALVLWCTIWLVFVAHDHAPGWPWLLAMLLPGLFLADLFSGLVHWGTDTWFDETQWCRVVSIARELVKTAETNEQLSLMGACIDGAWFEGAEGVKRLSQFPTREEAQSQFVTLILSPARKVVGSVVSPGKRVLGIVKQVQERLEKGETIAKAG